MPTRQATRLRTRLAPGVLPGSVMLIVPVLLVVVWSVNSGSDSFQAATTNGLILLVAALGLSMFWGNSGIMSLGHAAFMAVGAYAGGLVTLDTAIKATALQGLPHWLRDWSGGTFTAVLVVIGVALVVAAVTGLPLLRMAGSAFVIASYAVLVVVNVVLNAADSWTRGAQTFYGLSGELSVWTALACVAVMIVAARLLRDSSVGLQVRASREDELAARSCGIDVERRRMLVWVLSAVPAALAGFMLGVFLSAFTPATFYLSITVTLTAMVLVGGLRSVSGAVVGVGLITALLQVLQPLEEGFSLGIVDIGSIHGLPQLGMGAVILATLYLRPGGLLGSREIDELILAPRPVVAAPAEQVAPRAPARPRASTLRGAGISKDFQGVHALADVDIELAPGAIAGLIGPNGSGKTTLLNVLSGVLVPTSGRVKLGGRDVTGQSPHRLVQAGIGRTFQNIRLFSDLSVLDNVRVGAMRGGRLRRDGDRLAHQLVEQLGLSAEAAVRANALSYGRQRRLEIARALAVRPDFLLLDEPAAGMNEVEAEALRERIAAIRDEYGVGVLVVDHAVRMMMRLCEHITVLNDGHLIAAGAPAEVRSDPEGRRGLPRGAWRRRVPDGQDAGSSDRCASTRRGPGMRSVQLGTAMACAAVVALGGIAAGCGSSDSDSGGSGGSGGSEDFKIGAGLALTGGFAGFDQPALTGIKLGVKEVNAKGGLLGKHKIVLDVKDVRLGSRPGGHQHQGLAPGRPQRADRGVHDRRGDPAGAPRPGRQGPDVLLVCDVDDADHLRGQLHVRQLPAGHLRGHGRRAVRREQGLQERVPDLLGGELLHGQRAEGVQGRVHGHRRQGRGRVELHVQPAGLQPDRHQDQEHVTAARRG